MHNDYNVCLEIGCFKGTYSLQVKLGVKQYHAIPSHMAYTLQEPLKKNLGCLQQQQIIVLLMLRLDIGVVQQLCFNMQTKHLFTCS